MEFAPGLLLTRESLPGRIETGGDLIFLGSEFLAAQVAHNELVNNYLTHTQEAAKKEALKNAKSEEKRQEILRYYDEIDRQQDAFALKMINLARTCKTQADCAMADSALQQIRNKLRGASVRPEMAFVINGAHGAQQEAERRYWDAGFVCCYRALIGTGRLASQEQLSSLQAAVNTATKNGIPYNQMISVDGWDLKFAPLRQLGQLSSLIHALPN